MAKTLTLANLLLRTSHNSGTTQALRAPVIAVGGIRGGTWQDMVRQLSDTSKARLSSASSIIAELKTPTGKVKLPNVPAYQEKPTFDNMKLIPRASDPMPAGTTAVQGYDFNQGIDYDRLLQSYATCGFQATSFGQAVQEVNRMLACKEEVIPEEVMEKALPDPTGRARTNCTIFLSYTSNMISSGVREVIRFLVQHNMVDCIVTTGGGVEEDLVKCMGPLYVGDFHLKGADLSVQGFNRIGNLLLHDVYYERFEKWAIPILDEMLREQTEEGVIWTPTSMAARFGREIDHPESVCYWAYRNNIPLHCPAITDGEIGDLLYMHALRNPGLIVDISSDMSYISNQAAMAINSGMIIVGGGVPKHHVSNANHKRDGADYAVYLNTATEEDGCDSGARPDEAVSWTKIKPTATPVKVFGDATLTFPLLVAQTFAKKHWAKTPS